MDQLCKKNITIKVLTHAADVNVSTVSRACLKIPDIATSSGCDKNS